MAPRRVLGHARRMPPPAARRLPLIDANLGFLFAVLVLLCVAAWWQGGSELVLEGWGAGATLLVRFSLVIVIAFLVAGLAERLVPESWIEARLGEQSGLRGLLLATAAGAVTPSGPFVSMPIAAAMIRSGAGVGAVVAFVAAWALLALHRLVAWEVPFLGWRLALIRYGLSLVVPVLLGWAARALLRG